MSGMPWVKLWIDILNDFKILRLSVAQKWRFIELILVAAQCDAGGALVTGDSPVTHDDLAKMLRCDVKELEKDIQKLIDVGLVAFDDGVFEVAKFHDRQGPTQEEKRKKWRERQRIHRERVKKESPVSPPGVTPLEEEKKEEEEVKIKEEEVDLVGVVSTLFQNEIGELTGMMREQIIDWVENYPLEWIEDSIRIASGNNKRRVDYINGILKKKKIEGHGDNERGEGKENGIDMEKQREEDAKKARERLEKGRKVKEDE